MTLTAEPPLQLTDLQHRLAAADPAALLVKPRLLRRVVRRHGHAPGFGLLLPHTQSYVIDSSALLALVERTELGLAADQPLPPKVILLPRPDTDELAAQPLGALLLRFWRSLFHARIHIALDQKTADGKLSDAELRQRIERIGQTEFEEIRTVLHHEKTLLPPEDDRTVYVEFAAFTLELRFFDPIRLHAYFPAISDWKDVNELLAGDVEAEPLFLATRPQGAPLPEFAPAETDEEAGEEGPPAGDAHSGTPPAAEPVQQSEAEAAAGRGNLVRAALLRARTAMPAGAALNLLTECLRDALELTAPQTAALRRVLPALLPQAASGGWSIEARLLYDLQKACFDYERGIFDVDLLGWAISLGRRPLKQPRPGERAVLIYRHIRAAANKAPRVRIEEPERRRLVTVLSGILRHTGSRLRKHFRPLIAGCFEKVRLIPTNLPERVARDKLIEELLDRIGSKGFLTLGDVRDALSRNQLKLPDLTGPGEWLSGDQLLQLDRALAVALDGAYRPGEIYLRGLQRVSALAFGTIFGRLLVLFLLLPFGVAFLGLKGADLLAEEAVQIAHKLGGQQAGEHGHHPTHLATPWSVAGVGLFLLLLINVPRFRQRVFAGLRIVGRGLRMVLIDAPVWLVHCSPVRAVLESRPVQFFRRDLLAPLLLTVLAACVLAILEIEGTTLAWVSASVFVLMVAFLNSRLGRDMQEIVIDRCVRFWQRVLTDLIPGLFRLVMQVSRRILEAIDRVLYTVDEHLRFRTGESRLSLVLKGIAGTVWGAFAYVVRIYTNLLVEPTVNPIKHFPVVTVGHKLMLPFLVDLFNFLKEQVSFLGPFVGDGLVAITIFFLPGMFGFMVWEFKENWKLYRANRPAALRPVMIGSHGETMLRLLRPGFHSGTLPKLFAKLRRAERRGQERAAHRHHEGLHHVEESVRCFIEREFVHLLAHSRSWGGLRLVLQEVVLATNRVRLELMCPDLPGEPVDIRFDYCAGWLVAGMHRTGWLAQVSRPQREAFATALAGLYKLAGVDLTREQIALALAPTYPMYHLTRCGLVVWLAPDQRTEVVYPLADGITCRPSLPCGMPGVELLELDRTQLLFRETPVLWQQWVAAWQRDQSGQGAPQVLAEARVLPEVGT
jgi:hypothetical protein